MADVEHNTLGNTANAHGIIAATVANAAALAAVTPSAADLAQRRVWVQSDTSQLWIPQSVAAGDFDQLLTSRAVYRDGALFQRFIEDDFDGAQSNATGAAIIVTGTCFGKHGWRNSVTGAGAQTSIVTTAQDVTHVGVVEMLTGSTAAGVATGTQTVASVTFGSGLYAEQHWIVRVPTLSDGTDAFGARWGWIDVPQTPVNGVYFEYVQTTSINWRGVAMKASVPTVATGGTNVPVTAGAWVHLKAIYDGTNVTFSVENTVIGTVAAASVPVVACARGFGLAKTVGNTPRSILTDLFQEGLRWTPARAA